MQFIKTKKPKLLLHICCAGCGAYVASVLKEEYEVILYYFNPNIFNQTEYDNRLSEVKRIAKEFDLKLIVGDYNHVNWLQKIIGKEKEPERGERCRICYWERLDSAAQVAKKNKIDRFTTTLSVSPHKDSGAISVIGNDLADKYGVEFIDRDFKKQDGFKKSLVLSNDLKIYRQNFCGCEFSIRK